MIAAALTGLLHHTQPTVPGVVIGWYVPASLAINLFLVAVAALFLFTFRPRVHRGLIAYGIWLMALAVLTSAVPVVWKYMLTQLPPPVFAGELHAVSTIAPRALMAGAVICWLVWQVRERHARAVDRRARTAEVCDQHLLTDSGRRRRSDDQHA